MVAVNENEAIYATSAGTFLVPVPQAFGILSVLSGTALVGRGPRAHRGDTAGWLSQQALERRVFSWAQTVSGLRMVLRAEPLFVGMEVPEWESLRSLGNRLLEWAERLLATYACEELLLGDQALWEAMRRNAGGSHHSVNAFTTAAMTLPTVRRATWEHRALGSGALVIAEYKSGSTPAAHRDMLYEVVQEMRVAGVLVSIEWPDGQLQMAGS